MMIKDIFIRVIQKIKDFYRYNIESLISTFIMLLSNGGYSTKLAYLFYKKKLKSCNGTFSADFCVWIREPQTLSIGKNVSFSRFVIIDSRGGEIKIGDYCMIGPFAQLYAVDHRFNDKSVPMRHQGHVGGSIIIEDDCWLGANVIVTKDVRIGKGSVIGANSVVTRDIPPYSIAVGAPAKVIKKRN